VITQFCSAASYFGNSEQELSEGEKVCTARAAAPQIQRKGHAGRLSLLHRPAECVILQQPSVGGVRPFFEISNQQSAFSQTVCDPLPTEQ
jgi:hypothetical protein